MKFQFGDLVLGRVFLSLFRRNARLNERPLEIGEAPPPPPQLGGADGYVVWSHPITAKLPALSKQGNWRVYAPRQYRRFSINLSGNFERYLAGFSSKTRSGLRRKLRKFAEAAGGAIDFREYRTPEQITTFFPLARQISARTYQERLLRIGLPADDAFVASARRLAERDAVRAYLLFFQGEPASYLYCPIRDGVVEYDYLGYDPTCASLSPGTVLQFLALEALFAEQRFALFDFTEGEGQHKELFSTASCLCADVYVLDRRLAPVSLVVLHHSVDRLSAGSGIVLDRLNLRSSFRKLIRGI